MIDGCPAGLPISEEEINAELSRRAPGRNPYISPRKEADHAHIYSGVFEGKTTGTPISLIIFNTDADSSKYESIKGLMRPGHANFTYLNKYGIFDHQGGGRASARETVCRVAAGAIARKLLTHFGIELLAYIKEIDDIQIPEVNLSEPQSLREATYISPLFCPDPQATTHMIETLRAAKEEGDSIGGVVEAAALNMPIGLGDPIYEKLHANIGKAMLSIPAVKGIEFGTGFEITRLKGSRANDRFTTDEQGNIVTASNHAGGILGGISTGMPLVFRVAFKPTSSIAQLQQTVDLKGKEAAFQLPEGSRHDPCVAIRAVPVVEAMLALVLADALLMQRSARL